MARGIAGLLMCAVLLTLACPAAAQEEDDDVLDEKIRHAGWASGMAMQCAEGSARTEIERDVLNAAAQIGRLLGTDRAFYFAAAFGFGSADSLASDRCDEFLTEHRTTMTSLRDRVDPEQQP